MTAINSTQLAMEEGLPDTLKDFEAVGGAVNELFSVSPSFLKFPHDNTSLHVQRITVYNKTKRFLGFRVQEPRTNYFSIFYEKYGLHAGTEETIIIKCKPYDQKMCFDSLRIHITTEPAEPLTIPLELLPSAEWFVLPRVISMPRVSIGQSGSKSIPLPMPPQGDQPYYFFVSGAQPDVITVTPVEGRLGSKGGPETLTLTYTPREYTSLEYKMSIHFPEIEFQPYDVTVYMKCLPGNDGQITSKIPTDFEPKQVKPKPQTRFTKLPKPVKKKEDEDEVIGPPVDVFTPAGIMKFLLKRGGKTALALEFKGPTGLTSAEEYRAYKAKEAIFHNMLNKVNIHQQNILLQHTRNFPGDDPLDSKSEVVKEIQRETERAEQEYKKVLGMRDNDMEDMTRTKLKMVRMRAVRAINYELPPIAPPTPITYMADPSDPNGRRWASRVVLRRFIQAVLVIVTRKRADKRIVKLKVMIKQIKSDRKRAAEEAALRRDDDEVYQKAIEMLNLGKQAEEIMQAEQLMKEEAAAGPRRKTLPGDTDRKSFAEGVTRKSTLVGLTNEPGVIKVKKSIPTGQEKVDESHEVKHQKRNSKRKSSVENPPDQLI